MSEQNLSGTRAVEQGGTLQQVSTGYVTAVRVQVPRRLVDVRRRLEEEAEVGGEMMFYGWGAGRDHIEGPSIQLAMAAVRAWRNCAVEMEQVQDLGDSWVFTAVFIDIEAGTTLKRQFRQSKTSVVYGRHDEERKTDIRFQIGQSKAARNVVVNALPKGLINEAVEAAKRNVRARLEKWIADRGETGLVQAQDGAIDALKRYGVTEERVLAKLGRATRKALTVDDLIILRGDIQAIADGTDRAEEIYPGPESEQDRDAVMDHLGEGAKEAGSPPPTSSPSPTPEPPAPESMGAKPPKKKNVGGRPRKNPPAPTSPPPEEEKTAQGPNFDAETIKELERGSYGPEVGEAVMELRARYNRLGEDEQSLTKAVINWDWIEKGGGAIGIEMVQQVIGWYFGKAIAEGFPQQIGPHELGRVKPSQDEPDQAEE